MIRLGFRGWCDGLLLMVFSHGNSATDSTAAAAAVAYRRRSPLAIA